MESTIEYYKNLLVYAKSELLKAEYVLSSKFLHNKEQIDWANKKVVELPETIKCFEYAIEKLMA